MKRLVAIKYLVFSLTVIVQFLNIQALTLKEARQLAIDNYPLLKDYNLIALTEEYNVANAAKAWLPQVGIGMQSTWQTAVPSYPAALQEILSQRGLDIKGTSKFQWKAQVEIQQAIWDGGRTKATQDVSRREAEENLVSDEVELFQLRNSIDELFFGILLLEKQKETVQNSIALFRANLERVNSLVRNGAAMQSDADAIQAELLTTSQQLLSVESHISSYRKILSLYIKDNAYMTIEEPEPILIPENNNCILRPEQKLLKARQNVLSAQQEKVRKEIMPQIGAFARGYYGYPGMNFMESMMNHNPSFNAIVGLTLSWNLSPLYSRNNKLLKLQTASEKINITREIFEFNTDLQATKQRNEIERLRLISEKDVEIVALREKVRNASEARLREGIVEPTDLLLHITDEKNAAIAAISHRIEYLKALYQLQNTLNF